MKYLFALMLGCMMLSVSGDYAVAGDADENMEPASFVLLAQAPEPRTDHEASDDDLFDEYDTDSEEIQMVADPLYHFNYAMYTVNDFLYFYAIKPVAQGYKFVVPTPVRSGISNFFHNLLFPVRFVNNILQGKGEAAGTEFCAFFVNSTIGILGFNDFAQKHMDIELHDEDLGQTLGSYNIGDGFYLVLPVLGPSTLRDTIGRAGDWFLTPVNYAEPWEVAWGASILERTNTASFRIGDYEALKEASIDPYVALRNAYIQNRKSQIKQ